MHFPLGDQVEWVYTSTDPMRTRLVTVRVEAPVEIEVESVVRPGVRRERAWVLRESDHQAPSYAVEWADRVEVVRRRRFGKPERRGLVVTDDLRWGDPGGWSRAYWHYDLRVRRYRLAGEEQVTVTAGVFPCLKILLDEGEDGTIWMAPGVGIVRTVGRVEGLDPPRYAVLELHTWRPPAAGAPRFACARCRRVYREADNGPAACGYHPGRFCDYDRLGVEGAGAAGDFWDCCMGQVQEGESPDDVPACATGRHVAG